MAQVNVKAVITAEDRASKTLQGFSAKTIAIGTAIGTALGTLATKAVQGLTSQLGEAIKRVDTLKNAARTFENMGFKTDDVTAAMSKLNKSILGLPTPLNEAVKGMTMISAATNDVGKSQGIFSAMNDAILGFGGTTADVSNAVLQLSQDLAGGRIQAQTWNSMLQSGLGPTLAAMARSMGLTTRQLKEGLSDGSISVGKFTDQLIKMDKEGGGGLKSLHQIAIDSTKGISTSFENAKTAIVRALASVINSIGQANISAVITAVGNAIAFVIVQAGKWGQAIIGFLQPILAGLVDYLNKNVIPALKDTMTNMDIGQTIKDSWREITYLFSFLKPQVDALGSAFEYISKVTTGLIIPIFAQLGQLLGTQVGGAIVGLWHSITEQLYPALYDLWTTAGPLLGPVLKDLAKIVGGILVAAVIIVIEGLRLFINLLSGLVWGAARVVDAVNVVAGVVKGFANILSRISSTGSSTFTSMIPGISQVIGFLNILRGVADAVGGALRNISTGNAKGALHSLHVPGFAEGVQNFSGGIAMVGERGPELVNLPRGSSVTPNNQLAQVSQPTTVNVQFSGVFTGNEAEFRKLADKVFKSAGDVANSKNMSLTEYYG